MQQDPAFPLTTSPWIPVTDLDTSEFRDVGLTEALVRAHRLRFDATSQSESIVLLRLMAAALDAACGPSTVPEWDAAWRAETLDAERITAYMDHWAHRLDLFHPQFPAFQCGALTAYNRGAHSLDPASLGGASGAWFSGKLRAARDGVQDYPAWDPAVAARNLLWLLSYDTAGIKGAAPGDPQGKGNRIYGARPGPAGIVTHLHVEAHTLKDLLLLALPPQPRAPGDAPVWEQEQSPVGVRTRAPRGRLDWLTWSTRRVRLCPPAEDGGVDRFALHDGDRIQGQVLDLAQAYDPMTAWSTRANGRGRTPMRFTDEDLGVLKPWAAALILTRSTDRPHTSTALRHAVEAAERGVIRPDTRLRAVFAAIEWGTQRSVIDNDPVAPVDLGTASQLADPEQRSVMATRARYAEVVQGNLRRAAQELSGRPADLVRTRMTLTNLGLDWDETTGEDETRDGAGREAANRAWDTALHEAVDRAIESFPLDRDRRAKLRATFMTAGAAAPTRTRAVQEDPKAAPAQKYAAPSTAPPRRTPPATRGPGRPAAASYDVFGGRYTLSQISRMNECAVTYTTLRNRLTDPDNPDRQWTPQEVEDAATLPAARGRRRTT
ncbi:type I-E CRISPR-associated protein Cse1/CasA [Streptomyces anulatus]|uniref:type I-E CRISPR-associated protein Cse1/CasA n=1 Tax=Streptomyces anulatus TaxID=1892 RepID=UPI002F913D48|nr:type I-E CRISPR-associated protein Cse1/CasA [Streptomyces anulatus]